MTEELIEAPAHNDVSERAVIGAVLNQPQLVTVARRWVTVEAFLNQSNAAVFATICDLDDDGRDVDPATVVAEMLRRKQHRQINNGLYVFDLWSTGWHAPGNLDYHAREMRAASRMRAIQAAHTRLGQALEAAERTGDDDALLTMAARQSVELGVLADEPIDDAPIEGLATWEDFVKSRPTQNRWIVPNLIRRLDTIFVLGGPGAGKSFLSRMLCTALSSGVHPFHLTPITPVRTLLVDLENAPDQVAEESEPMLAQVRRLGGGCDDRGWVWMHPEGLNLRKHADAALLERVIEETRPQVLALGSLFNSYQRGRDDWDTAAEDVQAVFKRLRARYDLAIWLEGHMTRAAGGGHTGVPFGGTSWERWPTHGRVLRKAHDRAPLYLLEAGTFRGDRGERDLPMGFMRGGRLPLTAIYDEGEFEFLISAANKEAS